MYAAITVESFAPTLVGNLRLPDTTEETNHVNATRLLARNGFASMLKKFNSARLF